MDFQVITFDPITGLASLGIPTVPKIITGLDKLVQIVVLEFLRNPGRNVLAPTEGPGLRADIGQFNFTSDGSELKSLVVLGVKDAQAEILSRQSPNSGTPSERLQQLILKSFGYNDQTGQALLSVQIVNEAGDSRNVLL